MNMTAGQQQYLDRFPDILHKSKINMYILKLNTKRTFFQICGNREVRYKVVHNHAKMRPRTRSLDG